LAERAQRHAVPILEDLIGAVRTDQVRDMFDSLKLAETSEKASQIFERYIADLIRRFPTLNAPTRLDFGPARIIVLDLQYVAPTGSAAANRQTEMMYLLARHILARNFFLHPEYLAFVPDRVKDSPRSTRPLSASITTSGTARKAARSCARRPSSTSAKAASTTSSSDLPASASRTWATASSRNRPGASCSAPTISASATRSSSASG
jgi:hypothetical protein